MWLLQVKRNSTGQHSHDSAFDAELKTQSSDWDLATHVNIFQAVEQNGQQIQEYIIILQYYNNWLFLLSQNIYFDGLKSIGTCRQASLMNLEYQDPWKPPEIPPRTLENISVSIALRCPLVNDNISTTFLDVTALCSMCDFLYAIIKRSGVKSTRGKYSVSPLELWIWTLKELWENPGKMYQVPLCRYIHKQLRYSTFLLKSLFVHPS